LTGIVTVQPYDDAPIQAFTDDSITDELVAAAASLWHGPASTR